MAEMRLEEAIQAALQYEGRVIAVYVDAMRRSGDPVGRKVFKTLHEDEAGHARYLAEKLEELARTGRVKPSKLVVTLSPVKTIGSALGNPNPRPVLPAAEEELVLLRKALAVEVESGEFYRKMAQELPPEDRALFEPFIEIEDGHRAIVQAEIDSISGTGFWFDVAEFRLEAE